MAWHQSSGTNHYNRSRIQESDGSIAEEEEDTGKVEQSKHNFHHLSPLSVYSRMACNQETSVHHSENSFNHLANFKVNIVNDCFQKRKLENSSCDDGYETPYKRLCFVYDVGDIVCLSPVNTSSTVEGSGSVRSCQNPLDGTFQNKHEQRLEKRNVQKTGEEHTKGNRSVKHEEEDKGYSSMSNTEQLPTASSSPLLRAGEDDAVQLGCHPERSAEQAILSGQQFYVTHSSLCSSVSMPLLDSLNSPLRCFEGDVMDIPHIGPPIFESSLCRSDSVSAGIVNTRELSSEELWGASVDFDKCHTTHEEAPVDTSCEASLPLKVTVRSVVVAKQYTTDNKTSFPAASDQNGALGKLSLEKTECEGGVNRSRNQRPAIFNGELAWVQEKKRYIHLVTKHMNDKGETHDVMTELVSLMTHVADQTPDSGTPWQHPSNLTRRNFQRRFGDSTPKISLQEWQAKNSTTHKRFATVPRIFERSPLP